MIGIDSVKVGFLDYRLDDDVLYGPDRHHLWHGYNKNRNGETHREVIHSPEGKTVTAIYHTQYIADKSRSLLLFEFSAPGIVNYCNHMLEFDYYQMIDASDAIIHRLPYFADINIEAGVLYRTDFCCHHYVGNWTDDYINSLRQADYPHRTTNPYKYRGVQLTGQEASSDFYIKLLECMHREMEGVLRHETRIGDRERLGGLCGVENPRLCHLTPDIAKRVLEKDLVQLRLNNVTILDRKAVVDRLIKKYSPTKSTNLIGFWDLRQSFSKDQLEEMGWDRSNINRKERAITGAGISMLNSPNVELPPLSVVLESSPKS